MKKKWGSEDKKNHSNYSQQFSLYGNNSSVSVIGSYDDKGDIEAKLQLNFRWWQGVVYGCENTNILSHSGDE